MPTPRPPTPRNAVAPNQSPPVATSSSATLQPPPPPHSIKKERHRRQWTMKPPKMFGRLKSVLRSFPVISTPCRMPVPLQGGGQEGNRILGGKQMTGTLFGFRRGRINLTLQQTPRSTTPLLVLELSVHTDKLLHDMGSGLVRIALECEKKPVKIKLVDEPIWTVYCNGKKVGYAVKRGPTDDDLTVMEKLKAVSVGAGVIPAAENVDSPEGELTYVRAYFERVIGSKDTETYYMMSPDGNSGPELSIFFVRV